jgi:hypothetical protein
MLLRLWRRRASPKYKQREHQQDGSKRHSLERLGDEHGYEYNRENQTHHADHYAVTPDEIILSIGHAAMLASASVAS